MKKVISSFGLMVPPGNYFIEDILDICEILACVSGKVVISTDSFEFDSVEEVKTCKEPIKTMSINSIGPNAYINVNIDTSVWIYSSVNSPLARGAVEKIADLAKKCVKPFNIVPQTYTTSIFLNIIYLALVFILMWGRSFSGNKSISGSLFICSFMLFILWILYALWIYYATNKRKSTIKLIPRHDAPNFFKANSGMISSAVIGAIAGAIITFLLGKV